MGRPATKRIIQSHELTGTDENGKYRKHKYTTSQVPKEPPFVKLYLDDITRLHKLPATASSLICLLLRKLDYDSILTINASSKRGFAKELSVSVSSINNQFYAIVEKGIISRIDVGVYMFNPNLFARGLWQDVVELREKYIKLTITYDGTGRNVASETHDVRGKQDET